MRRRAYSVLGVVGLGALLAAQMLEIIGIVGRVAVLDALAIFAIATLAAALGSVATTHALLSVLRAPPGGTLAEGPPTDDGQEHGAY